MAELLMHRVEKVEVGIVNTLKMDDGRIAYSRCIEMRGKDENIKITMFSAVKKKLNIK